MKKIVAFLAAAALICTTAAAEIDLSGMTYDELIALNAQVTRQIMMTDKWQEVRVPAGMYLIGRDIPAGTWTVRPVEGDTAQVFMGTKPDSTGTKIDYSDVLAYEQITSPKDSYSKWNSIESVTWEFKDQQWLHVDASAVIFTPFAGLSFSFK